MLIDKTYKGARLIKKRLTAAVMIIGGFATLLFFSSAKPFNLFGSSENGVAHADVYEGTCSYDYNYFYDSGGGDSCGCADGAAGTGASY